MYIYKKNHTNPNYASKAKAYNNSYPSERKGLYIRDNRPNTKPIQRVKFSNNNNVFWPFVRHIDVDSLKMDTILCLDAVFPHVMALDDDPTMIEHVQFWRGPAKFVQMTHSEIVAMHAKANPYKEFLTKKASENQTILNFPNNLKARYDRLSHKNVRKVNRISGLMKRKGLNHFSQEVVNALDDYVIWGRDPGPKLHEVLTNNQFVDYSLKRLEFLKFLLVAVRNIPELNAAFYANIISNQEQHIEKQSFQKVIAHRGDGATFDKMGGVLPRADHDHIYNHEHENSEASTRKAMQSWLGVFSSLSGIECDVFLSQDNVPIVTHTQNLVALWQQENRNQDFMDYDSDVRNMLSTAIHARFMRLNYWLTLIEGYIQQKHVQLQNMGLNFNKRLRIEIEMKQREVMTDVLYAHNWQYVEKVVSRFMKNSAFSHLIEIAMFNNSNVPAFRFQNAKHKTMLSHITYAQGGAPNAALPEVRFGMHQKGIAHLINNGTLDNKIVTFAPGLDHPGGFNHHRQLLPVHGLSTQLNVTIEQSIQSARHKHLIALMETRKNQGPNMGPTSVHTLTDHGLIGGFNILNRGLAVGKPDAILDGWRTDEIRHKHPELSDAQIRNAVAEAQRQNNLRLIGELLIRDVPELL